ncbi:MAG: SDR family oxidoreductase [Deltaproteobacteria bacterium]|nr:SDR family oxidoreductase [Deltaproteobacteria bacterium]
MMRPDVLIVGASGFVGGALRRVYGETAAGTYCRTATPGLERLDVRDAGAVDALVDRLEPRLIIHPAAQPNVDRCETEIDESYQINVTGTVNVARAARRVGARYLYFSTDYVFNGEIGPAQVESPPDPLSVYGRHKLEAEVFIQQNLDNYVIARVCGVFGFHPQGKNFIMALLDKGRRGEPMRVPCDQWGTPTYVDNLADAVKELAELDFVGIAHPVGPDFLARTDFAHLAAEILELDPSFLRPTPTRELGQTAARPVYGGVDNRSTQALLRTRLLPARDGLLAFKRRMEQCA